MNVRLPVELYSPDQLGIIMLELRTTIDTQRDAAVKAKVTNQAATGPKPHLSGLLTNTLIESKIETTDMASLEEMATQLRTIRDKAPVAHIILTASPTPALKAQLVRWFRTQINPYTLLSFATREDIGGGLILRAGSHIYDLSFRTQLKTNKTRIAEIYHGVQR
ncbi:MAG TPA: F0F1 ATP synthase subunit delta [Candidatus Saccharimonadales bacterium]|nr:F0F1 ATP synthase subunit delta [Candidatus Saccharimonadales bacterium]